MKNHSTTKLIPRTTLWCLFGISMMLNFRFKFGLQESSTMRSLLFAGNNKKKKTTIGRDIVERAHKNTYLFMEDTCASFPDFRECVIHLHEEKRIDANVTWWFETMIRDVHNGGGLFGSWHHDYFHTPTGAPNLRHCTIEKIGSKDWKKLGCEVARETGVYTPDQPCNYKVRPPPFEEGDNFDKSVMLRDPLERFLSGFLDKCIHEKHRVGELHCEPNDIFRSDQDEEPEDRTKKRSNLVEEFLPDDDDEEADHHHPRMFFEAYVDTFPLKWNVHFLPQSMYCNGLYRELGDYDYVGYMGENFHDELRRLGRKYKILPQVREVFRVPRVNTTTVREKSTREAQVDANKSRKASKKILDFFTAKTVRRLLEIFSIDYVHLGMPIPEWAEEMLQEERNSMLSL